MPLRGARRRAGAMTTHHGSRRLPARVALTPVSDDNPEHSWRRDGPLHGLSSACEENAERKLCRSAACCVVIGRPRRRTSLPPASFCPNPSRRTAQSVDADLFMSIVSGRWKVAAAPGAGRIPVQRPGPAMCGWRGRGLDEDGSAGQFVGQPPELRAPNSELRPPRQHPASACRASAGWRAAASGGRSRASCACFVRDP